MIMKKAVTLLEVLVTSIILGIVLTGVSTFLTIAFNSSGRIIAEERAQSELSLIMNLIKKDIRNGSKIKVIGNKLTVFLKNIDESHSVISEYELRTDDKSLYRTADGTTKKLNRLIEFDNDSTFFFQDSDIRAKISLKLITSENNIVKRCQARSYITCRNVY